MIPKEKAKELVDKFIPMTKDWDELKGFIVNIDNAKQCALISVEEMLDFRNHLYINEGSLAHQYLIEVKQEIEKL